MQFNLFGIKFSFNFWFFVVMMFFLTEQNVLITIAVHELGHILTMLFLNVTIKEIAFLPFGIAIKKTATPFGYAKEAAVYSAGIAANILLMILAYCINNLELLLINILIAGFNLLPIGNLDGGQLIKVFLRSKGISEVFSKILSFAVLTPLFAFAIFLILHESHNFSLLITCIYLSFMVIMA